MNVGTLGLGGNGGGGNAAVGAGVNGTANTGGGGGANSNGAVAGGNGGSGIVIVRYTTPAISVQIPSLAVTGTYYPSIGVGESASLQGQLEWNHVDNLLNIQTTDISYPIQIRSGGTGGSELIQAAM